MSEAIRNLDVDPDDWFEIIEGVKIMNASPRIEHNTIASRIFFQFDNYFFGNNIKAVLAVDIDVYLPDGNIFRPDLCVGSDRSIIGEDGKIHGVPELVVEVLSPSTMNNDLGTKMTIYARNGVREYWIIDQHSKNIYVYKLSEGYYKLDVAYHAYTQTELDALSENERAAVKDKIQVGIFPDLLVDVKQIFRLWFD